MCCYFNDVIGSMTFLAYCNLVFIQKNFFLHKMSHIMIMMIICSIFWEIITPLFRVDTVADVGDVFAYCFGGFLYWKTIKDDNYVDKKS